MSVSIDSTQSQPEKKGSLLYELTYKKYYFANKEKINQKRKESGKANEAFRKYYAANREAVNARNLARYYKKKAEKTAKKEAEA